VYDETIESIFLSNSTVEMKMKHAIKEVRQGGM
jgi:hypothetical protein